MGPYTADSRFSRSKQQSVMARRAIWCPPFTPSILSGARQSVGAFVRNRARCQTITVPGIELVEGEASAVTSTVRDLAGKEATSFSQFAKDYANSFVGRPLARPDRSLSTFRTPARETSPEPPAAARLCPPAQNPPYPRICCASWCPGPWSSRPIPSSPSLPR